MSLAGLSLMGTDDLAKINPALNLTLKVRFLARVDVADLER